MGVTVIICRFKDGKEQDFTINEIESVLSKYMQAHNQSGFSNGIDFFTSQPWFEHCGFEPSGAGISAILISKPHTESTQLEEVLFRLLSLKHSVLMSEHFDMFHSRTDMKPHFPEEMQEMLDASDEDDPQPVKIIQSARDIWPAEYKDDFYDDY